MSFPNKIKAIVLTCDRYRAITRHVIFQYDQLWPDHPFVFHIPYQELGGTDTQRVKYFTSPSDIKGTVLHLLAEIDDEAVFVIGTHALCGTASHAQNELGHPIGSNRRQACKS